MPRGARRALVALAVGLGTPACTGLVPESLSNPRMLQEGSRGHAYLAASFVYSFADGTAFTFEKTLEQVERDLFPLLEAARAAGHELTLELADWDAEGRAAVSGYELALVVRAARSKTAHRLPGKPGTQAADYEAELSRASEATKLPKEVLQNGHFALYALANVMTSTNATHDTLTRHAFKLLLLRGKLERGERQVDFIDPNRPAAESIEDIDLALRVLEDDHRRQARERAQVLAMIALASGYRTDGSIDLLREEVRVAREQAGRWRETHARPTAEDFGVKPAALPTAESLRKQLGESVGFVGSLAKVAQGVLTANPGAALEGLAELAPEDGSSRAALEGLAAAAKGDVAATVEAIGRLSHAQEAVGDVKGRLGALRDAKAAAVKGRL